MKEFGRGGGDRKDELLNKACVLYALQPPLLSNWNKRNTLLGECASAKNLSSLDVARVLALREYVLNTSCSA